MKPKRYRGTLVYDGTRYAGFQWQSPPALTVQAALEAALTRVTQQKIGVTAAGRTDAGVHASGQVIAFDCDWKHPVAALWRAINANLPADIALKSLDEAAADFHPRFDATSRRYVYRFYTAPVRDPLRDRMAWYTGARSLVLTAMQSAASLLVGTHDFATFGQPPQGENTVRTMFGAGCQADEAGNYCLTLEANAFLKHMVRSITGTLVEVGRGKRTVADFAFAFKSADRRYAGQTAPPQGLVLEKVGYRGESPLEK